METLSDSLCTATYKLACGATFETNHLTGTPHNLLIKMNSLLTNKSALVAQAT